MWSPVLILMLATSPRATLDFASEAPACREQALREAVALRLGYDPFEAQAPLAVSVRITGDALLTAKVTVTRSGAAPAVRTLSGRGDCVALTGSLALALAVAIDPSPSPSTPAVPPTPPTPPPPMPSPLHLSFGAGAAIDLGQQPGGLAALRVAVGFGGETLTGFLEPTVALPSRLTLPDGGALDTFFLGATAGVCASVSYFTGCGVLRGGALRFEGIDLEAARQGWLPSLSAGARLAAQWPKDSTIAVQVNAEFRVPITRLRLLVGEVPAWEQPFITGTFGLTLVFRVQ